MKKKGLTVLETIVKGKKETYQTPSCTIFSLSPVSMLQSSVSGETDNKDVSEDPSDPWNTGQGE